MLITEPRAEDGWFAEVGKDSRTGRESLPFDSVSFRETRSGYSQSPTFVLARIVGVNSLVTDSAG